MTNHTPDHPRPMDPPPREVTAEDRRRLDMLDAAVDHVVWHIRDHQGGCPVVPRGLCVGSAALDDIGDLPPLVWQEMLVHALSRLAAPTPPYVHRILDAFISGDPLDFEGADVPEDVRVRVANAVDAGRIRVRPADPDPTETPAP